MLTGTVTQTYPEKERDWFMGHFRGLVGLWVTDQKALSA
jgi:hypothetical protein